MIGSFVSKQRRIDFKTRAKSQRICAKSSLSSKQASRLRTTGGNADRKGKSFRKKKTEDHDEVCERVERKNDRLGHSQHQSHKILRNSKVAQ